MGAVQDGAGAAAASSQGMGGMGGDDDGLVVVLKTSAQLRPGPGDAGAPGSVSPWLPPSANEAKRFGACAAIDATAFQPLAAGCVRHRPNVYAERKRTGSSQQ